MQQLKTLTFESNPSGLWGRFITKIIASWIATYLLTSYLANIVLVIAGYIPAILTILIALGIVTWRLFQDQPLKWRNKVVFDFDKELIQVTNSKNDRGMSNVLDFEGNLYPFKDIESYSTARYESFLFSAYFLVSIHTNGKKVKLLALKEPEDFTKICSIFKNNLKLKVQ